MKKHSGILLVLKTYALVLSIFFVFRSILFYTELDRVDFQEVAITTIIRAFIMGIRFDTVIASYIIFVPAMIFLVLDIAAKKNVIVEKIFFWWILVLFSITFVISAIDIPYFNQFFSRLSISAFEWMDNFDLVFSMIVQEPKYFLITLPLVFLVFAFYKVLRKIFKIGPKEHRSNIFIKVLVSILFLGLIFLGIRGRFQKKSPIRTGTAYFSDHAFLNQLGLNPTFTLLRSYIDSQNKQNSSVRLIDDQRAISNVRRWLHIKPNEYNSPIARKIEPDTVDTKKPNIVLILMESMSAAKMARHGNTNNLTPFLDSISERALYFENIYTSGKHTFNGIFGTLFSFPALYRQHPMRQIKKYRGMGTTLKNHGYSTTYFTTHDGQFDNVEGFLRANDFQNVISEADYPISEVKTSLGVPDDYMFRYAIPIINKLHSENKPFFVSLMTTSDHGPYYVPDYFKPHSSDIRHQIVEYADWSLQRFIALASKEDWFNDTIFVFIADHGSPLSAPYDISLDYHHTPLIFYAPKILPEPRTYRCIGGQIDVFPTIMGLIRQPYINNTLGIDLLKEERPFIFINDDDKIGVLNDSLFLILKDEERTKLYKYKNNGTHDYSDVYPEIMLQMQEYVKANMQVLQYMLLNERTLMANKEQGK